MTIDVEGPAAPPRANGELVFEEPWESRAFGVAVALSERDAFKWERFQQELIEQGSSNVRSVPREPRFGAGDRVRGRTFPDARHVRIPGYAQGKVGTVHVVHEAFVFPDTNLRDEGENPEHVYGVAFRAADLWPDADQGATVVVDLWESYLEEAV